MSVLQAIESQESKNPLVNRILQTCQKIFTNKKCITFCWILCHKDVRGMKRLTVLPNMPYQSTTCGVWNSMNRCSFCENQANQSHIFLWQERWDKEVINKLHTSTPQSDEKYYSGCTNSKEEVIIDPLRIGRARLTYSFRIESRPHPPLYDQWEGDHELTVKYIWLNAISWRPFVDHIIMWLI